LRSEEFDDASWGKVNSSISANQTTAPNNTLTSDKIIEDSTTGLHYIQQSISHTSGVVYSVSFFAKAGERTAICLQTGTSLNTNLGNTGQFVSLITGEPLNSLSGVTVTTQLIAGFWRIKITFTAASTSTSNIFILLAIGTSVNYAGDGTSGLFLWGAQLEAAPTASSYIPTVASTVTRVADVVSKDSTNFVGTTEATIARFFNGDKIADVYSGGEKVSYVNGVAQAPVTEAIPSEITPEEGHTQVLATLPTAITQAEAIALTS
jgi:hypothetical protein